MFIIISILFGVRWFFGNEGNQPTFVMKEMRGAKKGGEQISNRSQKKKLHCDDTTQYKHDDDYEKR